MRPIITKATAVGLSALMIGTFAFAASAAPKLNVQIKNSNRIENLIAKAQQQEAKMQTKTQKAIVKLDQKTEDALTKSAESSVNSTIRTAQDTFNKAIHTADVAYKNARRAAHDQVHISLVTAGNDQPARTAALTAYRNSLLTAIQQWLTAKQTAFQAFISVLQNIHANLPPLAYSLNLTVPENTATSVTLTGNDPEHAGLTFSLVTNPAHGTLSGTIPALTYTPSANFTGADSFTFKVNDGSLASNTATASITVTAANAVPTTADQSTSTLMNVGKTITLSGADVNGCGVGTYTYAVTSSPANGVVTPGSGNVICTGSGTLHTDVTYVPNAGFTGTNTFSFKMNDGATDSNTSTVTITVTP